MDADPMNHPNILKEFAGEYMRLLDLYHTFDGIKAIVFYEEFIANPESALESLRDVLGLPKEMILRSLQRDGSNLLRTIGGRCEQNGFQFCGAACRNIKAALGMKTAHLQRRAPATFPRQWRNTTRNLETLMCEANALHVNLYALRSGWGSGELRGCTDEGVAEFHDQ